jgi:hypothetical protein
LRLEELSHVLVWTSASVTSEGSEATVDLLELPRLRLTFRARAEGGSVRLYCEQHEGFFITNRRSGDVMRLLDGVPNSLLLEHHDGGLSVLVSAATLPTRVAVVDSEEGAHGERQLQPFPAELELACGDAAWLRNLGSERHYLYPVHTAEGFLFCPSLGASLHLILLRLLARQYDAVAAMAGQAVCDTAPSAEERQLCARLAQANDDRHPDAHACRLRLQLCALHTPLAPLLPWDLHRELVAYALKRRFVSLACRLELPHELLLLRFVKSNQLPASSEAGAEALGARQHLLESLAALDVSKGFGAESLRVRMTCPQPVRGPQFDALLDKSCVGEALLGQLLGKLSTLSYSRPDNMVGMPAVQALDKWINNGLELRGGRDEKGFLFL